MKARRVMQKQREYNASVLKFSRVLLSGVDMAPPDESALPGYGQKDCLRCPGRARATHQSVIIAR